MKKNLLSSLFALALVAGLSTAAHAQIKITEVDANGSSASYGADWFELKNTGAVAIDLTGWKMDDNSSNFLSAVSIRGITSIAAGQSVVFLEGNATGTTDGTINTNFATAWFGGGVPSGLVLANYGGSSVGLSGTTDAVNIFDSTGAIQAYVSFGASTTGFSFDNSGGANGTIAQLSVVGVNGAFSDGSEVGSPGGVAPVPEPSTLALGGLGLAALGLFRRSRKA